MINLAVFLVAFMISAFVGFAIGCLCREQVTWNACLSQQKRGDYWFERYREESMLREDSQ